jgi:hypothetical protein
MPLRSPERVRTRHPQLLARYRKEQVVSLHTVPQSRFCLGRFLNCAREHLVCNLPVLWGEEELFSFFPLNFVPVRQYIFWSISPFPGLFRGGLT